ncbi:MAG: hypothetical protein IPJ90_23180 [Anaerolineaceae bacterium]|nr:hypothetical protein [Anaerolineaceae bacterium]
MIEMWLFFIILLLVLLNHFSDLRLRDKMLAATVQKSPIGQVEMWVNAMFNRYKHDVFSRRRDFYAELVFTEKAIIIFRMLKLGPIKLRSNMLILAKNFDDIPQVDGFWYWLQTGMLYRINSIVIDGRSILLECTLTMPPGSICNRTILHKFLLADLRDNNAYKNVLLLHRHISQKMPSTF